MPTVAANGIEIAYDEFGDAKAPVILLIMGLGTQMIAWPVPFCEALAARGFRVVRFDNRDIGLSTKFDKAAPVDVVAGFTRALAGEPVEAPYTLNDMAADAVGLMEKLGIARAHIVGASMGGMIAQVFAARHNVRTKTLAVIFSSNNQPVLPPPGPKQLLAILQRPKGATREAIIENAIRVSGIIGSPGYPAPADRRARLRAGAAFRDRPRSPDRRRSGARASRRGRPRHGRALREGISALGAAPPAVAWSMQ